MRLSRFFITRPIFAAVIAILITVMGGIAYFGLPVSQYPDIVPPTVTVLATYPGADAETVASTVAAPRCSYKTALQSQFRVCRRRCSGSGS